MDPNNKNPQTEQFDESIFEGVSQEVADKYRAELGLIKPAEPAPAAAPTPAVPAAPAAAPTPVPAAPASPVPPTVTGVEATPAEPTLEEQLAKEYPNGTVPISALIAERKKRQELEKQAKPATAPAATPTPAAPASAPAPMPAIDNKRLVQEAIGLWEQSNAGQVFDPINPVHMAEMFEYKTQVKAAYDQVQQQQVTAQQETLRQQQMQQRYQVEVVGNLHTTYGAEFPAIDKFAGEMLAADPREQYYVFGSLMQGNFQPMHEFYAKAAAKYREATAPRSNVKTEAEKLAEIEALPGTAKMAASSNAGGKTEADIERMIMDGSWRNLPEKEREAIIARLGGGSLR